MNAVFVDFDGVLNNAALLAHLRQRFSNELSDRIPTLADYLDPKLVRKVGKLCQRHNAMFVVSSSWRNRHSRHELREILRARGLPARIPVRVLQWEGREEDLIRAFVRAHHVPNYVVLDDVKRDLPGRQVMTSGAVGVTDADIDLADWILTHVSSHTGSTREDPASLIVSPSPVVPPLRSTATDSTPANDASPSKIFDACSARSSTVRSAVVSPTP